jgi:hypothetical protein
MDQHSSSLLSGDGSSHQIIMAAQTALVPSYHLPVATRLVLTVLIAGLATSCSGAPLTGGATSQPTNTPGTATEFQFPDVVDVKVTPNPDGTFKFDVTISSPYDSPEQYADAWRVIGANGTEFGIRELLHDHAGEQPFTRSLDRLEIPADVLEVTVEGRDLVNGWGGLTMTIQLP